MRTIDWERDLAAWLKPFLDCLSRQAQRRWAPVYLKGLLLPGERKSVEPMAQRVAPGEVQQLHHFVAAAPWATAPLEDALVRQSDRLVGSPEAVLVIDDTALVKQGRHSVGVQRQYCGQLGKRANCQALVSLALAGGEVPLCVGLRLFLPESWSADPERCRRAGVPDGVVHQPKWRLALNEIDRVLAAGARFGCVLADAEYGKAAAFRQGLSARRRRWAVGILPMQQVYPSDVTLLPPAAQQRRGGRPAKHPRPSVAAVSAAKMVETLPGTAFRTIAWRQGTKGPLKAAFAAVRVRVADGPPMARNRRLPGAAAWLVCERRATGERKYYLTNHPAGTPLRTLAATLKRRWVCEQMHQQMKEELGLDHFEGRSWGGLHHHALMCMLAFAFLQHRRLAERKNRRPATQDRATPAALPTGSAAAHRQCERPRPLSMSTLRVHHPQTAATIMNMAE